MKSPDKITISLSKKTMLFLVSLAFEASQYMNIEDYEELQNRIESGEFSYEEN